MSVSFRSASWAWVLLIVASLACRVSAATFQLPTANRAIFEKGQEERFFVPTVGKTWPSGTFGCVRSDGRQFHEGLDIRCLQRDKRGEPIDPVMASMDGSVAYVNRKPQLSNYGNYIVLRHQVDGLEVFTTYAHLREIRSELKPGVAVKAGETIGVMGRTANTREGISKDRAHVHFEINLFVNDSFPSWYKKTFPGQRNDHGLWNGQNMLGLDPQEIFMEQQRLGAKFNLVEFIQKQPELCRVFVRGKDFPWVKRYGALVQAGSSTRKENIVGYELTLNFNGIPVRVTPRSESESPGRGRTLLLSINEQEQREHSCRKLVVKRGSRWELSTQGQNLLGLLVY